jgi:hypothetical protein
VFKVTGIDKLRFLINNISENIEEVTMDGMEEAAYNIYDKLRSEVTAPRETAGQWDVMWSRITRRERDIRKARMYGEKATLREYVRSLRVYRDPARKAVILAPDIEWSPVKSLSARYRFAAGKCPWWRTLKAHEIRQIVSTPVLRRVVDSSIVEIGKIIYNTIRSRLRI